MRLPFCLLARRRAQRRLANDAAPKADSKLASKVCGGTCREHDNGPEGRERLRESALRDRPWLHSTGPRTPDGKARVALNGKARQKGRLSVRELRASLADVRELVRRMRETRSRLSS